MAKIVEMTNMRCIMRADEEKIWLIDCNKRLNCGEKSSFLRLKVSKILNRAVLFEKLLSFYDAGVTNLQ